jgi:hypothetical protein
MPSTHSTNATGTHSTDATLRKRTLNGFDLKDVRSSVRERVEPSNQLLEVLFELGWEGQKIRRETPVIYRQIGGIGNESAFVSEIRRAMMDRRIKNPYAYALALLQRQGPRTAVRRAPNTGDAAADLDTVIRNFLEKRQ